MKIYIPNCSQKFRVRRCFDVAKKVKIEVAVEVAVSSYRPLSTRKVASVRRCNLPGGKQRQGRGDRGGDLSYFTRLWTTREDELLRDC